MRKNGGGWWSGSSAGVESAIPVFLLRWNASPSPVRPPAWRDEAYSDHPLPIEGGQTISQPYIVARMTEALELVGTEKVLEIGTGSGYQTAILAELAREVCTIERIPDLAAAAQARLTSLGYRNIRFFVGDGTHGLPEEAPFDRIIVTGALPASLKPSSSSFPIPGSSSPRSGDAAGRSCCRCDAPVVL